MTKIHWTINFVVSFILLCAAGASAADSDKVKISTLTSVDKVRQGSTFHVAVVLDLADGWHAYDKDTKPPFTATNLKLTPPTGFTTKNAVYPKGEKKNFKGTGEASVYEGKVVVGATLTAAKDAPLGKQTLKAALSYQVCNDVSCQRPVKGKPVDFTLEVVRSNASVKELNKEVFSKPPFKVMGNGTESVPYHLAMVTPTPLLLASGGVLKAIATKAESISDFVKAELGNGRLSLPLLFLLWFGGILSAFSPCVIPVIPMTVAFFGNQSRQAGGKAKALVLAWFYVAGITTLYTAIGVAAVLAGKSLSFLLQGPALWLFMVVLFGAMGLSMFGLFEIPVPAFITSVGGAKTGFVGAFLMGLVAAVLFLPCAGPVVGGLAGGMIALAQNKASTLTLLQTGVIAFVSYSVGLGTPFLALALLSGSAMKAPKSGDWTLSIKRIFGMVFVGLSLYFMKNVPHNVLVATFLLGCGVYLAFFEKGLGTQLTGKSLRIAAAAVVMFMGVSMGLQPAEKPASNSGGGKSGHKEIAWRPYSDTLLKTAAQQGKPVVIDFTADW